MPPTDPDHEGKSPTPKDKDDNPFIKFKRFADAQIGAVLQGIIGLPSVFSKQPNDADSRWADLHDDLKRRDKVLTEQQAPKTSGSSRYQVDSEDDVDIPVKKFQGWSSPASTRADLPNSSDVGHRSGEQDSIALFAPLTKSLFAHLVRNPIDDDDWRDYEPLAQFLDRSLGYTTLNFQQHLRSDQKTGSALSMIQSMIFNTLSIPSSTLGNNQLFASPSVLPYILFSPYSPLALSSMPPPSRGIGLFEHLQDDFPYCAAFEDLLLASQGRPMANLAVVPAHFRDIINSVTSDDPQDKELWKANSGLDWIERLWDYGLLTKVPPLGYAFAYPLDDIPFRATYTKPEPDVKKLAEATSKQQRNHNTEQDVYDFLERVGGSLSTPLPFRDAMQAMEAFIKDAVEYLAEQENDTAVGRADSSERASPRIVKFHPDQDESGILRRPGCSGNASTSTQTEAFPDNVAQANATRSVESDQVEEMHEGLAGLLAADRVVATTTTTQQTTDEDGAVHTTLMIRKTFADGRTSVTTTTKTDFPPRDRHRSGEEWLELPEDERCPNCDAKYDEKEEQIHKKEKKSKGWFWS